MAHISSEQKMLLALVGENLFSAPSVSLDGVDPKAVIREAQAQAVLSIAFAQYKRLSLDQELAERLKTALMKQALASAACFQDHTYLHKLMTKHGISYCAVKGAASAAYYPDPMLRSMGDVDFYVHPNDIERAQAVFVEEGFAVGDYNHPSHIVLSRGRQHFEMHFKPIAMVQGRAGDMITEYWSDILEASVLNESELAVYRGPSVFHHGFILLTHLQHHLSHEGVGLRHLLDWALFVNSFSEEEFLAVFQSQLKRIGLFRLAQLLSLCAVKHMGMEHRTWMGDDYETADELLEDILSGGNFGKKDENRKYEGLLICDRDGANFQKSRFTVLLHSLNRIVDIHWRAAKKFPLLYPIGWVFFSTRYLIRVLLGKRTLHPIDNYKKSGERKKKYAKIRLFEPEE